MARCIILSFLSFLLINQFYKIFTLYGTILKTKKIHGSTMKKNISHSTGDWLLRHGILVLNDHDTQSCRK